MNLVENNVVALIAGRKNGEVETLYWKYKQSIGDPRIGDYAIVENMNGFDLINIAGVVYTTEEKASYFSKTKYCNMKSAIKFIEKTEIENNKED